MNSQIIKYYAGELSKEERKALLQKAFSNQELKNEDDELSAFAITDESSSAREKRAIR